jgi:hypothetical protein
MRFTFVFTVLESIFHLFVNRDSKQTYIYLFIFLCIYVTQIRVKLPSHFYLYLLLIFIYFISCALQNKVFNECLIYSAYNNCVYGNHLLSIFSLHCLSILLVVLQSAYYN